MLDPTKKKDTPCPKAKKPQQDGRRGEIEFRVKPQPSRDARRAQVTLCMHIQDPDAPQRLSQTCLSVFECLLQRHRSAVACHRDRGSGCSRPEQRRGMWHQSSWRRSPLSHHRATEQSTHKLENNYTKEVLTLLGKL